MKKTLAKTANRSTKSAITDRTIKIIELHNEAGNYFRQTVEKAVEVGELLTEQKKELKHGEWLPWINKDLPFVQQTVWRYMNIFENRAKLLNVSNLIEAYKLLETSKKTAKKFKKKKAAPVNREQLQKLIDLYERLFKQKTGKDAYLGTTQYTIVRNLMRKQDHQEIADRLRLYFSNEFWFTEKNDFSLKNFIAHFNEIMDEETDTDQSILPDEITSDDEVIEELQQEIWREVMETPIFQDFLILYHRRTQFHKKRKEEFQDVTSYVSSLLLLEDLISLDNSRRRIRKSGNSFTIMDIKADEDWKKAKISLDRHFKEFELNPMVLTRKNRFGKLIELLEDETFDFDRYCEWYADEKYPDAGFNFGLFLYPNVIDEYRNVATDLAESEQHLHTSSEEMKKRHAKGAEKTKKWIDEKIIPKMEKDNVKTRSKRPPARDS